MDTPRPNPTINPPPLAAVHHRRLHSRSPSHSPMRQPNPRDWDPLLRDLSPTATLRTFQTADTDSSPAFSFRGAASVSERAWGAKAAQTCLDLRSWVRELEEWKWPGSFAVPKQEPAQDEDGKGEEDGGGGRTKNDYWGSLPASIVLSYEKRADEIIQQLDNIDVEELKDFVLSAHRQAGSGRASRDDSIASIGATTDLRRLDDFTALITATILQALPYLSRLHRLLDVWTVRLTISRNAPSYLSDLRQVQTDVEHGWAAIAVSTSTARPRDSGANFTRGNLIEMQSMIQHQVTSLGRRLDTFLDHLEGREETVPDAWIDDFERLEKAYGDWVVQAERKALENEWRAAREREMKEAERTTTARLLAGDQLAGNASNPYDFEDHERDAELVAEPSSRPSSGLFALPTSGSQRSSMLRHSSVPFDDLAREDSETLPYKRHSRHLSQTKALTNDSTTSHEMMATDRASKRARHMPIIIDFDRDGHKLALMDDAMHSTGAGPASNTEGLTALPIPPPPSQGLPSISREPSDASKNSGAVKKRAAFLESAGIERKDALNRSVKSPVRPFEHASNAFTRLFQKREKTPEPIEGLKTPRARRSMSGKSRSGSIKRQGGDNEQVVWGGRGNGSVTPKSTSKRDRISSGPAASPGKPDIENLEKREARSRSSSFRRLSFGRSGSRPSAAEPSEPNGSQPTNRDHADLPGGFRTRSTSENSLPRARSRTSQTERPGEVRRLRSQHRGEPARPPVETYQPKRLSSPFKHVSDEHKEPDYPVDWPLASPPETERNSPVKEQQDELAFDDPDSFQPTLAHQQPQKDQDYTDDDIAGPEIQFSRAPLETDAFDRMFVSSLPASPELERPQAKKSSQDSSRGPAMDDPVTHDARRINPIPTLEEAMLGDQHENLSREDLAIGSAGMPGLAADESETPMGFDRRAPLEDGSVLTKGEFEAEEADGRSSVSRDISDGEGEDMQDNMDYFGDRPSPIVRSRAGSISSAAEAPNVPELQPRIASPSKSPVPLKLKIPGAEAEETQQPDESPEFRPALLSRASVASIGSYPRASLRSIDVSRRSSLASPIPVAQSPRDSVPVSAIDEWPRYPSGNLLNHDSPVFFPHPPRLQDGGVPQSPVSPLSTNASPVKARSGGLPLGTSPAEHRAESRDDEESEDESPRSSRDVTPAPLNVAMAKRRAQQQNRTPVASGVSLATTPNVPERHRESTPPSSIGGDKMDRHVSEVLNRLPSSSIKFKARPGAVTPTLLRTSERRDYSGPRPRTAPRVPSRTGLNGTGGGDMTLAPAEPSTAKKSHTPSGGASEGEVKLYHLTQAGREDPIKLFVRLVGEGERVMVRVGGGWADLADYLRQYADHHGSRTVSSGSGSEMTQSALQQSSRKASSSSLTPTPLSRTPLTPDRRPGSRLGVPSTAGQAQQAPNNDAMDQAESDNHETATSFLRPSAVFERTPTVSSANALTAQQQQQQPPSRSTPQSTSSIKNSSRPSTAGSLHAATTTGGSSRPGSSSNRPPTIGNRNPKAAGSVESLLPEQKAKWVEEMLEQARAGATGGGGGGSGGGSYSNSHGAEQEGEKKGTSEGYFGELGTAGATRRVVFRPSQPSSHHLGGSGGSGKR
ncbi:hypothetical protein KC360_g2207 [Hortaea werneckii]|nr:hypothetical protein KC325_g7259 [Hortaea werneckii]KAI6996843.1 hypothetical protein KC359_g3257 [Hortaea werneckii]KAI7142388.1 hypothetical protein KC344_g7232 [Hortaea werneckii]KAI7177635.1 hypothetical protein KC360_g2207 [Hortaea werneckii]